MSAPGDRIAAPHEGPGAAPRSADATGADARQGLAPLRRSTALVPALLDARRMIHAERRDARSTDLFRELRSSLLQTSSLRSPVILVSGVRAHCGASYVARNLAIAIAMEPDRSALLIDCNLDRPSQDAAFDLGPAAGLADYLGGSELPLERIVHASGIVGLQVVPAGSLAGRSSDLLGSLRMRALLEGLRQDDESRCLVLDAPPACGSPEARVLAQRANQVILVAGEALHTAEQVIRAARVFDPARFVGVVFNEMP